MPWARIRTQVFWVVVVSMISFNTYGVMKGSQKNGSAAFRVGSISWRLQASGVRSL